MDLSTDSTIPVKRGLLEQNPRIHLGIPCYQDPVVVLCFFIVSLSSVGARFGQGNDFKNNSESSADPLSPPPRIICPPVRRRIAQEIPDPRRLPTGTGSVLRPYPPLIPDFRLFFAARGRGEIGRLVHPTGCDKTAGPATPFPDSGRNDLSFPPASAYLHGVTTYQRTHPATN